MIPVFISGFISCLFVAVKTTADEHGCLSPTGTMAVPPSFSDLGKSAKDIFNKGFGNFSERTSCTVTLGFDPRYSLI